MRAIFSAPDQQAFFEKNGYAILPEFLAPGEVKEVVDFYHATDHGEISDYFYCSFNTTHGPDFIRKINAALMKASSRAVAEHFDRAKLYNTTFLVKKPNPANGILPHQDWSMVDEDQFNSITIWVPFVDVDLVNGTLGVLNGSHRMFNVLRCSPLGVIPLPYAPYMVELFARMEFQCIKAGDAIAFDNRTLHASLPNASDELRIAAGFGVTQEEAVLKHNYLLPGRDDGAYETYAIDEDFFLTWNNEVMLDLYRQGKKPEGLEKIGEGHLNLDVLSVEEITEMMDREGLVRDPAWAEKAPEIFPSLARPWAQERA